MARGVGIRMGDGNEIFRRQPAQPSVDSGTPERAVVARRGVLRRRRHRILAGRHFMFHHWLLLAAAVSGQGIFEVVERGEGAASFEWQYLRAAGFAHA